MPALVRIFVFLGSDIFHFSRVHNRPKPRFFSRSDGRTKKTESNPNYEKYKHLLSDGFFGYKVDNSDGQYAGFRNNLPLLVLVLCIYLPLSHIFNHFVASTRYGLSSPKQTLYRTYFFLTFSCIYLYFMYGNSLLKIGLIVGINYGVAKIGGGSRWMPLATWVFNLGILFLNEGYRGYNFGDLHDGLTWLVSWNHK